MVTRLLHFIFVVLSSRRGCDPLSGESLILARVGENYEGTIDIASSTLSPGDFLKYKIVTSDPDGVAGIGAVNFH